MATTILIRPKNKEEKNLLTRLLKKMSVEAEVIEDSILNPETVKAMDDVELGKGIKVKDSKELFSKLGI